jgi:HNH endonuclease
MTMKKVCRDCGEEKELGEFYKAKDRKDGRDTRCGVCTEKIAKARNEKIIKLNEKRTDFPKKKKCSTCHKIKSTTKHFYFDLSKKDGYKARCKECRNRICREQDKRKKRYAERVAEENKLVGNNKRCSQCNSIKSKTEFYKRKRAKDGLCPYCKDCKKKNDKAKVIDYERRMNEADYKPSDPKYCHHCEIDKTRNDFYENRRAEDGKAYKCIACNKAEIKVNATTNTRARQTYINNFKPIAEDKVIKLLQDSDYKCHYCGTDVQRGINLHIDHRVPLSRNGPHTIENLAISCAKCNLRKNAMTDTEFFELLKQREQMVLIKNGDIKEAEQKGGFIKTGDAIPITHIYIAGEVEANDAGEVFKELKEKVQKQDKAAK